MINAVSADGLMTNCIHPWAGSAHNLYFVQWNLYIVPTILCSPPRQVVSLDRCIIHAAYINYGQCRVCRCLVQRLHSAMGRHGIALVHVSWASLSTWRMIVGTILALYINYGQYCVCRCLVLRLHPVMGRHGMVLMLVSWALLLHVVSYMLRT